MIMRNYRLRFWTLALLLPLVGTDSWSDNLTQPDPRRVVEELQNALIETMQRFGRDTLQARFTHLAPRIKTAFDFETISRIVCGRSWLEMNEVKKSEFIAIFRNLSTATYADNFASYSGELFEIIEVKIDSNKAVVKTEMHRSSGSNISLVYLLQENSGQWKIINVISEGVSDLSLKRSEYDSIIKSKSLEALMDGLKRQLAKHGLDFS